MDRTLLRSRNTADINRVSARCLRVVVYFLLLLYAYILIRDKSDIPLLSVSFGICVVLALIPGIMVSIFHLEKKFITKHVIIICTVLISMVMVTQLNLIAYPMILFPLLLASLYYNRTFVLYSALLTSAALLGSAVFQIELPRYVRDPVFTNYDEDFAKIIIPLIFLVITTAIIAFFIVDRNSMMIDRYIDTAITMQQNEHYLIYAFSEISENKSKETGEHIRRVAEYMRVLGLASGFDPEYCDKLAAGAMMHDIGKLMIPEEILDKPSKLTREEYQIMKNHVLYGEALLNGCPGEIMRIAATLAKEHHERWDGSGYLGMKGEEIAYISRLIAVCDVFDALTTTRSYKVGWSVEDAYAEIVSNSGKQFDPKVVRLFINNFDKFREIHEQIPDK
ncbi:MAG: HD-GYP domain-containing protein [Eubacterium sp.]|nr:HD-GYP domain-containing protein [Eubacterium sp.]